MKTGIVIVTHNSAPVIAACLRSLPVSRQDVVVIDNASTDATVALVKKEGIPYLPEAHNLGFATAANVGGKQLAAPYLLFLNPDCVLEATALERAEEYLDQHAQVGAVGLLPHSQSGQAEQYAFGAEPTPRELVRRKYWLPPVPSTPLVCDWVSGAALLIRSSLWRDLEGFDPAFFLYWEDVDLCRRIRQAGYQVVLLPQARVSHKKGHSLQNDRRKAVLYDASADIYYRKHYAAWICSLLYYLRRFYRYLHPRSL